MNHVVSWLISGSCTERHQCVSPCDEKKTVGGSTKGQRLTGSVWLDNVEGQKENVWARKNLGIAQRLKCVGCMVFRTNDALNLFWIFLFPA